MTSTSKLLQGAIALAILSIGACGYAQDFSKIAVVDYNAINGGFQIGAGVGIRMDIGIGPMKFDVGFPVMTGDPNNGGGLGAFKLYFDGGYQF